MATSGPGYLRHVVVRRVGIDRADHSAVAVLLPTARAGMRRPTDDLLAQVEPGGGVLLGRVVAHRERELGCGRRAGPISWDSSAGVTPRTRRARIVSAATRPSPARSKPSTVLWCVSVSTSNVGTAGARMTTDGPAVKCLLDILVI